LHLLALFMALKLGNISTNEKYSILFVVNFNHSASSYGSRQQRGCIQSFISQKWR
jgi:hypothetical protein